MKNDITDFFKIHGDTFEYFVSILTKYGCHDLPHSYGIDFGHSVVGASKNNGYISIYVKVPHDIKDERFKEFEDNKKIAEISWIGYNSQCSITESFPSGTDTIHLMQTAMTFVCKRYKWIEHFQFIDDNKVPCIEGIHVHLASLSLVIYGKTYFEKYFCAYLQNQRERNEYLKNIEKLGDPYYKFPYEMFINLFCIREEHPEMKNIYNSKTTYIDFFNDFKEHTKHDFCRLVSPWIQEFIYFIIEDRHYYWFKYWLIDPASVEMIDISNIIDISKDIVPLSVQTQEQFLEHFMNTKRGQRQPTGMFTLEDLED